MHKLLPTVISRTDTTLKTSDTGLTLSDKWLKYDAKIRQRRKQRQKKTATRQRFPNVDIVTSLKVSKC